MLLPFGGICSGHCSGEQNAASTVLIDYLTNVDRVSKRYFFDIFFNTALTGLS